MRPRPAAAAEQSSLEMHLEQLRILTELLLLKGLERFLMLKRLERFQRLESLRFREQFRIQGLDLVQVHRMRLASPRSLPYNQ